MELKNKTVLVTGGLGMIGSHLVKKLVEDYKCEVIIIDDLSSEYDCLGEWKDDNTYFYHASILNDEIVDKIFINNDIDVIFHLAALSSNQKSIEQPKEDLMINGIGTLKILQYAQKYRIDKVIFASSSRVYGNKEICKEDDCVINPETPYAITKHLGEEYCDYFYHYYGVKTVILRIFNCYGPSEHPGKYKSVVPNFFKNALNKRILIIYGAGEETRNYIYIDDVIEMIIKATTNERAVGEIINIGTDIETKTIELSTKINNLCGNKEDNVTHILPRGWDNIKKRKADISKAREILGIKANIGLDEGLRKTYDWFIKHSEVWKDKE